MKKIFTLLLSVTLFASGFAEVSTIGGSPVIEEQDALKNMELYTSNKSLFIKNLPRLETKIQVINLTGSIILEKVVTTGDGIFSLETYSNGIYLVRVSVNNQTITKRISLT